MEEVLTLPVPTISHVPRKARPLLSHVLTTELRHARQDGLGGFVRLSLIAKATLRTPPRGGRRKRYAAAAHIATRLRRWQEGDLVALWSEARSDARHSPSGTHREDTARCNARRALREAREGRFSVAMRALGAEGCASTDDPKALSDLAARHPHHALPVLPQDYVQPPPIVASPDSVLSALRSFPQGSSPGGSRLRAQHLLDATAGSSSPAPSLCLAELTRFLNTLLAGRLDPQAAPWLVGAPLIALPKKNGSFRPIAIGEVLRRLTSRLCCLSVRSRLPEVFLPYNQVGVGIRGGLEAAVHSIRQCLSDRGQEENLCCFKVDMQNAFNECDRLTFLHRLHSSFPELVAWVHWCYHCQGELRFGPHPLKSSAGVQQGDPLGPLLFSLVLLELQDTIGHIEGLDLSVWYLDDGTFIGTRTAVAQLLHNLQSHGPAFGLHLNLPKCEVFWPSGIQTFPEFPPAVRRIACPEGGTDLLGSPIFGTEDWIAKSVNNKVEKILSMQAHLDDLDDPQVELHLLRSCLSQCKLNSLLRTLPSDLAPEAFKRFDAGLRHSLETITHSSLDDQTWKQATLPIRLGGLGLRESSSSASAAFVGSRNTTRSLTASLLGVDPSMDTSELTPEDEFPARASLREALPEADLTSASQHHLQDSLDRRAFTMCKALSSLRDQARLNSITSSPAGAWLRAIPNPNLGLAMPQHEFIVAIRMWLGIPLFPPPPHSLLCTCGQTIDHFGDHLMGCGHGPLRIMRHNALRDTIWHALLQDNNNAVREQHCGEGNSRPGDVYHPDFQQGKPAYFDISVRSSLQPQYLNRAAHQAGAAGEAGEAEKDTRHAQQVEEAGGLFFPLVVESLGLWTPSSLRVIKQIASKASSLGHIPRAQAISHLLQQLSMRLWSYNAKLILSRWSLDQEIIEGWDLPGT